MREFVKDYAELCKDSGKFYKKHWKGCVVMNVAIVAAEMAYFNRYRIADAVKEKFHKGEES